MITPYIVVFWFGALMGSFLNVVGLRFLKDESIIWPGSHCTACNAKIRPWDNIPVLSWLILRARCRDCKAPIHWQYPLVEAVTGTLFVATIVHYGFTLQAGFLIYLICNFMVIFITDFREQVIFDANSIGLIPFGLIYAGLNLAHVPGRFPVPLTDITVPWIFVSALIAVVGAFVVFYVINFISRLWLGLDGFGEGDTRLLMGLGAFFGIKWMLIILALSVLVQAAVGLPMMMATWLRHRRYRIFASMAGGLLCAALPYGLQLVVSDGTTILFIALGFGILAMVLSMWALHQSKNSDIGMMYMPFGPAIVVAALATMYFSEPILTAFRAIVPV